MLFLFLFAEIQAFSVNPLAFATLTTSRELNSHAYIQTKHTHVQTTRAPPMWYGAL